MSQKATAVYEHGVLRLLSPLDLPEHTQVQVVVEKISSTTEQPAAQSPDPEVRRRFVRRALIEAGLVKPVAFQPIGSQLSEEELAELDERTINSAPLSEIIIEERRESP